MLFSLKDKMRRARFAKGVGAVLHSPPLGLDGVLGLHVLSQLQHKDVLMYLAAIKSFARQVPVEQVHVLDDGSLSPEDRAILAHHVPGIQIRSILEFRDGALPAGGTWERLSAIARLSEDVYVVQLDADTLTTAPVPEVVEAIAGGRSWTIGTWDGQTIESALERSRQARTILQGGVTHVQVQAESAFKNLAEAPGLNYVRGCSGFAGFAPGAGKLDLMRNLSSQLEGLLGPVWREWGSEQVMSNLVVANQPRAMVLPHPAYCDCNRIRPGETRFIHFIGACRFTSDQYADMIRGLGLCDTRRRS